MADLRPEKSTDAAPLLDYNAPIRSRAKTGCLVLAILLAVAVGGLCSLAFAFILDQGDWLAIPLGVGLFTIIIAAIAGKKYGLSAAVAISLAALCAFLLMIGICSQFSLKGL